MYASMATWWPPATCGSSVMLMPRCWPSAMHRPGRVLLSDLVNPLVITEQGVVKPVAYDFDRRHDITTLHDLADAGLAEAALARYVSHGLPAFKRLVGEALAGLQQHTGVLDWFDHLARRSERHPLAVRAMAA